MKLGPWLRNRDVQAGLALLLIGLGLRLFFLWEVRYVASFRTYLPGLDVDLTWRGADHLVQGRTFSMELQALSAPVFPWFVALFRKFTGGSLLDFEVFLAFINALRTPLLYGLCRRLSIHRAASFIACFLFMAAPAVVYLDTMAVKVGIEMTLLVATLLVVIRGAPETIRASLLRGFTIGALLAVTFLLQLNTFLYVAPIGVYLFLHRRSRKTLVATALPALLLPIIAIGAHQFRPRPAEQARFVGRAGVDLYIGNHAQSAGIYTVLPGVTAYPGGHLFDARVRLEAETGSQKTAKESDAHYRNQAIRWVLENPGDAARLWAKKTALFFNQADSPDIHYLKWVQTKAVSVRSPFGFGWMTVLAVAGVVALLRARRYSLGVLLGGLILALLASNLITFVSIRFRLPALVSLTILGAFGIEQLAQMVRAVRDGGPRALRSHGLALLFMAAMAVFANYPFMAPLEANIMQRAIQNDEVCAMAREHNAKLFDSVKNPRPSLSELVERAFALDWLHRYTEAYETLRVLEPHLDHNSGRLYIDYLIRLGKYDEAARQLERWPTKKLDIVRLLRCSYREAAHVLLLKNPPLERGFFCFPNERGGPPVRAVPGPASTSDPSPESSPAPSR